MKYFLSLFIYIAPISYAAHGNYKPPRYGMSKHNGAGRTVRTSKRKR